MSDKIYTTNTAALKATTADIRTLDAKKLSLNGKNILDYISDSEFNGYDTRDPQLKNDELDIWNTEISLSDNGCIEVKPHMHSSIGETETWETPTLEGITDSQLASLRTAVKVIDNEVLDANNEHIMYWLTDGLTTGNYIFDTISGSRLTSFNSDLSNLTNGDYMFNICGNLASFNANLKCLVSGVYMFCDCLSLTSFTSDLSSLVNGTEMFDNSMIATFTSDLSSLTHGSNMFCGCWNLSSFTSDLPNLINGFWMFWECTDLTSFSSDVHSLTDGRSMFCDCLYLTSFSSNLPSLIYGGNMFSGCKLDAKSVSNIIHTLPTHETTGSIDIGIGCNDTEEDRLLFAQECHCDTWQELLDEFSAKNWTVTFQCNGRPTATYNMRRGENLPVFVKIEEVIMPTEEEKKRRKPHYSHTSLDGSKFYQLTYFHSTNGSTEGYTLFNSIEEAEQNFEITPKQRIEK